MPVKRVIAYYMHESERAAAQDVGLIPIGEPTASFILGEIDDSRIEELRDKGLIVQEELPVSSSQDNPPAAGTLRALTFASELLPPVGDNEFPAADDYYRIWLNGPLLESTRQKLAAHGVTLREVMDSGAYKARLTSLQVGDISTLAEVERVDWLVPARAEAAVRTKSLPGVPGQPPTGGVKMLTFDVRVQSPDERPLVETWLREQNLVIAGTGRRKIRFYAVENAPELVKLANLPEVDLITEYVEPTLSNDHARRLLAVDLAGGGVAVPHLTQDGQGQIIAVADTGIDDRHPDFQGRIVGMAAWGRAGNTDDPHGHGTHVAGSVLGDGSASGGQIKGIAPGAQLFFQSLLDINGKLGGLPVDLNLLFDQAYQAGARIHNNSWGSNTPSSYTVSSEEVDEFVSDHRDMLIVIAAGNDGTSLQPRNAAPGFVDWLTIGSPASCKNALTVGASRSDRGNGPMAQVTWGAGWPGAFPFAPIAHETISGDPESMAAFSSRGPCDDRRIKPDVVAPGTDILSTKSTKAPISNYWGAYPAQGYPKDPNYAFDGGTSMAAPLVAGCAALVRQYYGEEGHGQPSAALLKATLMNSTKWLSGTDSTALLAGKPNFHQGHGRIDMSRAIPNSAQPGLDLRFVDDWQHFGFTTTGQRRRYQFTVPVGGAELRICMAYTDAPGRALQNNLNLIVQHQQTGKKYVGNEKLPGALMPLDTDNNVECIRIDAAPAGIYFIQVFASNLLKAPQDFALVVTGDGVSVLTDLGG
jgi:serine protease AprX